MTHQAAPGNRLRGRGGNGGTGKRTTPQAAALDALGIDRLVCAVHDRSLPSLPGEDIGCGSLASDGGGDFFAFLSEIGFTGVQLGPPGRVAAGNPSPYDATVFSRSELGIAARPLVAGAHGPKLLSEAELASLLAAEPQRLPANRADYRRARRLQRAILASAHRRWDALPPASVERRDLEARLRGFVADSQPWLTTDALHAALAEAYGSPDPALWPGCEGGRDARLFDRDTPETARASRLDDLCRQHACALELYAREQLLAHEQHFQARRRAQALGLRLIGDLQVGLSQADRWAQAALLLRGYALGAPPSRTNPDGQPWGYPVLDPALYRADGHDGPGLAFVGRRIEKLLSEYDGLRIDHPHGLVCPWVYRTDLADPLAAVQAGARLFSAPARPDHPALAPLAIARPEQLAAGGTAPYADDWVCRLEERQLDAYAILVDRIVEVARARGRDRLDLCFEVLSTQPYPLARVLARHGLGRFRITQKADVERPDDVYLPEQAQPSDWIMTGTHDTPPVWAVVERWEREGSAPARARYLARRLCAASSDRGKLLDWLALGPWAVAQAELAVLFTSAARNVMIFVSDLLGEKEIYNHPGVVRADNWTLRVPRDFRRLHAERAGRGAAFDLPSSLALALAALPGARRAAHAGVLRALCARAHVPLPPLAALRPDAG